MAERHYGEVVSKREYMTRLGSAIELGVVVDSERIKIFENAAWTLKRFEVGDEVTWSSGGLWAWLKDPRGTGRLEKKSEYWEQGTS